MAILVGSFRGRTMLYYRVITIVPFELKLAPGAYRAIRRIVGLTERGLEDPEARIAAINDKLTKIVFCNGDTWNIAGKHWLNREQLPQQFRDTDLHFPGTASQVWGYIIWNWSDDTENTGIIVDPGL